MKIVVIGGVAGGASAAARIRRLNNDAQIVMLERGPHVSFSNCSLPYYIGNVIKNSEELLMMTPEAFKKRFDIDVRINSEATAILREEMCVMVRDQVSGKSYKEPYDKLVLAPGASPVRPKSIKGIDLPHVFTVRNVVDVEKIKRCLETNGIHRAAVVGGGFIGMEMVENLVQDGRKVSLIEGTDQVMAPFDYDMAQILHKELLDNGIDVYLSSMLREIKGDRIIVEQNGKDIEIGAEAVILAIGVAPESKLAEEAGLALSGRKAIKVDHNFQTSDPDIYAVGDAIESYDSLGRQPGRLPLAGPAQRQARAAADHICGIFDHNRGYIGSSCVRLFSQNAACTGMNERAIQAKGIPYDIAYLLPGDKVGIMPESHYMAFKLLFETPTGRILGAQAIGKGDVTKRIDAIAAMITMGGDLEDLKDLELCYSPVFGTAKDVVNLAAMVGLNLLYGRVKQVPVSSVRRLVEDKVCIIDVRESKEYEAGHLVGSVNIPLSQFRERIEEVPRDVPVYLHCRTSQRSYYAYCQLVGRGYRNIYNISGSFLGICLYEYFNDKTQNRTPIVTQYNFN